MNWKLIFSLTLVGVAMAFLAVVGWLGQSEPIVWLAIWIGYAVIIAKAAPGRYFLHGWLVSVINGVWIAIIHATFYTTYIANNPKALEQYESMPHFAGPQVTQLAVGPIIGALTGLIVGLFCVLAAKVLVKKQPA